MRKITKAFATFIVLARDEGRAELLAREYIKKEELLKEDLEILDMEEVPTDKTNNSKHYKVLRDLSINEKLIMRKIGMLNEEKLKEVINNLQKIFVKC